MDKRITKSVYVFIFSRKVQTASIIDRQSLLTVAEGAKGELTTQT